MSSSLIEEIENNWEWSAGDPEEIFILEEEIAAGSFGNVYKVIIYIYEVQECLNLYKSFINCLSLFLKLI